MTRALAALWLSLALLVGCGGRAAPAPTPTAAPAAPAAPTATAAPAATFPPTWTPAPTATRAPRPTPTPEAATAPPDPPSPGAQLSHLVDSAEALRELETLQSVPFERMNREALRAKLEADIEEEIVPAEVAAEDQMLKLLGLIPQETDLLSLTLDLYESQITGFYDTDEASFFLISEEGEAAPLGLLEQVTFVHEYVHALQDQHFDLNRFTDDETTDDRTHDESRAFQALVEGDAQWATTLYLLNDLSPDEVGELMESSSEVDLAVLEQTPPFLAESLAFPYVQGLAFVRSHHLLGGWEAVDALWDEPPVSTEQVLHPERYPDDVPTAVALPEGLAAALGAGWTEPLRDVWGEYDLLLMLQQQPLRADAGEAAAGWDGDLYLFLTDGEQGLFVQEWVWDSPADSAEARRALLDWLQSSGLRPTGPTRLVGDDGRVAFLRAEGDRLRVALASAVAPLDTALGELGWE